MQFGTSAPSYGIHSVTPRRSLSSWRRSRGIYGIPERLLGLWAHLNINNCFHATSSSNRPWNKVTSKHYGDPHGKEKPLNSPQALKRDQMRALSQGIIVNAILFDCLIYFMATWLHEYTKRKWLYTPSPMQFPMRTMKYVLFHRWYVQKVKLYLRLANQALRHDLRTS